jgi:hypothetical protein
MVELEGRREEVHCDPAGMPENPQSGVDAAGVFDLHCPRLGQPYSRTLISMDNVLNDQRQCYELLSGRAEAWKTDHLAAMACRDLEDSI